MSDYEPSEKRVHWEDNAEKSGSQVLWEGLRDILIAFICFYGLFWLLTHW